MSLLNTFIPSVARKSAHVRKSTRPMPADLLRPTSRGIEIKETADAFGATVTLPGVAQGRSRDYRRGGPESGLSAGAPGTSPNGGRRCIAKRRRGL